MKNNVEGSAMVVVGFNGGLSVRTFETREAALFFIESLFRVGLSGWVIK